MLFLLTEVVGLEPLHNSFLGNQPILPFAKQELHLLYERLLLVTVLKFMIDQSFCFQTQTRTDTMVKAVMLKIK